MSLFERTPILTVDPIGTPAEKAMEISDELDYFVQSYPGRRSAVVVRIECENWSDKALFVSQLTFRLVQCERPFKLTVPRQGDIRLKVFF